MRELTAPTHDKDMARQFLAALDPKASKFTFHFFSDGPDDEGEVFHQTLDEIWSMVEIFNTPKEGVGPHGIFNVFVRVIDEGVPRLMRLPGTIHLNNPIQPLLAKLLKPANYPTQCSPAESPPAEAEPKNNAVPFTNATPPAASCPFVSPEVQILIDQILKQRPSQPVGWSADELDKLKVKFGNIRHRRWLYSTYLIRGEITVMASPGGVGKTALAMAIAVEIATGIELLGEKIFGKDHKVLYITGEDSRTEMERRVRAFYLLHADKIGVQQPPARLYVLGPDDAQVQNLSFLTTEKNFSMLDRSGIGILESTLEALRPDVLILDPLVAFCRGNMNDNAVMAQLSRELKRLAAKFDCAILIVHHTRKGKGGSPAGEAEDISGAAAIVNLARRALMPVSMTKEEADKLGVLPSEQFRYVKLVDAKSNLAPRSTDNPWYELHSRELPNAEPPTYPNGDNVQAIARVYLPLLNNAAATAEDHKIRRAVLDLIDRGKVIDGQSYPYSPSEAGANKERALLNDAMAAVGSAMPLLNPCDLKAVAERAIAAMKTEGWLVVKAMKELVSKPGRFRSGRGLTVIWALTPWPKVNADG